MRQLHPPHAVRLMLCLVLLLGVATAWSYSNQQTWPGSCRTGSSQSPVSLDPPRGLFLSNTWNDRTYVKSKTLKSIKLTGIGCNVGTGASVLQIVNNGYTLEASLRSSTPTGVTQQGCKLRHPETGEQLVLSRVVLHSQGEHQFAGLAPEFEAQLEFRSAPNSPTTVIVAVPLEVHEHGSRFLHVMLNERTGTALPREANQTIDRAPEWGSQPASFADLLPKHDGSYFSYSGSKTTPPCTESVQWFVMAQPSYISDSAARAFKAAVAPVAPIGNSRAPQPLNGRVVNVFVDAPAHGELIIEAKATLDISRAVERNERVDKQARSSSTIADEPLVQRIEADSPSFATVASGIALCVVSVVLYVRVRDRFTSRRRRVGVVLDDPLEEYHSPVFGTRTPYGTA